MSEFGSPLSPKWSALNENKVGSRPGLVLVRGPLAGTIFYLKSEITTIGSALDNDIRLPERGVLARHVSIRRPALPGSQTYVYNLGIPTDVTVNGIPVRLRESLNSGDRLAIRSVILEFFVPE